MRYDSFIGSDPTTHTTPTMGFRFRKSVRIGPVRINSKSVSVGVRGASVNLSQRGVRGTVNLPGTGLSYSEMIGFRAPSKTQQKKSFPVAGAIALYGGLVIGLFGLVIGISQMPNTNTPTVRVAPSTVVSY